MHPLTPELLKLGSYFILRNINPLKLAFTQATINHLMNIQGQETSNLMFKNYQIWKKAKLENWFAGKFKNIIILNLMVIKCKQSVRAI